MMELTGDALRTELKRWRQLLDRIYQSKHPDYFWPIGLLQSRRYAALLSQFALQQLREGRPIASVVDNPAAVLTLLNYLLPGCAADLSNSDLNELAGAMLSLVLRSRDGDLWNVAGFNRTPVVSRGAAGSGADVSQLGGRLRGLVTAAAEGLGFVNHRLFSESAGPFEARGEIWVRRAVFPRTLSWAWSPVIDVPQLDPTRFYLDTRLPEDSRGPWFDAYANPLWAVADGNSSLVRMCVDANDGATVAHWQQDLAATIAATTKFVNASSEDQLGRQLLRIMASGLALVFRHLSTDDLDRFMATVPAGLIVERVSRSSYSHVLEFLPMSWIESEE